MNPGSQKARSNGCSCPVLDNEFGEGCAGMFYTTQDCPLHGWEITEEIKEIMEKEMEKKLGKKFKEFEKNKLMEDKNDI